MEFEHVPEPVYWYRFITAHGWPSTGTWVDQPVLLIKELDAVKRGLTQREREATALKEDVWLSALLEIKSLLRGVVNG